MFFNLKKKKKKELDREYCSLLFPFDMVRVRFIYVVKHSFNSFILFFATMQYSIICEYQNVFIHSPVGHLTVSSFVFMNNSVHFLIHSFL